MASRFDKLGQQLERAINPIKFRLKAATRPWEVHPDLRKEIQKEKGLDIDDLSIEND